MQGAHPRYPASGDDQDLNPDDLCTIHGDYSDGVCAFGGRLGRASWNLARPHVSGLGSGGVSLCGLLRHGDDAESALTGRHNLNKPGIAL